ncbi:hypothetical protein [Acinetobacter sp. MB5]|uniref:hypothetical protein n=1 Tax=Acinetobacter sp. MB5 TaxID=2069438 RepID=UPI0013A6C1FE|nr:hypothetical protein [Acinetobacter sp. MB5]
MEIVLYKTSNFLETLFGVASTLCIFFNGKNVGSIKTGESQKIVLPDMDGILQVGTIKTLGCFEPINRNPWAAYFRVFNAEQ